MARRSRNTVRALAIGAALVLGSVGCSAVGVTTQAGEVAAPDEEACPDEPFVRGVRVLSCAEAVRAAERELGPLHWPIASANFAVGVGNCPKMPDGAALRVAAAAPGAHPDLVPRPPDLRCSRIGRNTAGTVTMNFWFGEPVRMYVALDANGVAVASASFMDVEGLEPPGPANGEP